MLNKIKKYANILVYIISLGFIVKFIISFFVKQKLIKDETKTTIIKTKNKTTKVIKYKQKLNDDEIEKIKQSSFTELIKQLKK